MNIKKKFDAEKINKRFLILQVLYIIVALFVFVYLSSFVVFSFYKMLILANTLIILSGFVYSYYVAKYKYGFKYGIEWVYGGDQDRRKNWKKYLYHFIFDLILGMILASVFIYILFRFY